jgi:hypothetical protein
MPPNQSRFHRVKFESFGCAANPHRAWFYKTCIQGIVFRFWRSGRHVGHGGRLVTLDVRHRCKFARQGNLQWT